MSGLPTKVVLAELTEIQRELEQQWLLERRTTPPIEDPRYQFLEEIARGGAAVVWRVRDKHLHRETAIKFLLDSHDNQDMRARLEREARLCARLVHPCIVPIHELSSFADQRPFVSMKLVKGQTLLQWLESDSPPSLHAALEVFCKVCEAMAFAHEQGIIHRDLKPSNIMVGSFGEVQIMDWGLAKELCPSPASHGLTTDGGRLSPQQSQLEVEPPAAPESDATAQGALPLETTLIGSICGTLAYMAPEQAQGRIDRVDRRSDVFALGGVLCRLLTGAAPYQATDHETLLGNAQAGKLHDAFQRLAASPQRKWAKLAQQCLAVERHVRPADASELAAHIAEIQRVSLNTSVKLYVTVALLLVAGVAVTWLGLAGKPRISELPNSAEWLASPPAGLPVTNPFLTAEVYKDLLRSTQSNLVVKDYPAILAHYSTDAELHRLTSVALINAQRFAEAEQVIHQALTLDPTHPEYHHILCDTLVWQGKLDDAGSAIQRSLECRDAGRPTLHPIDHRAGKVSEYIAFAQRLVTGPPPDPERMSSAELRDLAYVCEITDQLTQAEKFYKLALAKDPDLTRRSMFRHQLIGGFLFRKLCVQSPTVEHRQSLARLALEWMQDQFSFAAASLQDPQATPPSKTLMKCLKHNPELHFLRELVSDGQLDPQIRRELSELFAAIDRVKTP